MFEGPFDDKYKQIGNAVSPMFSQALANQVDSSWFGGGTGVADDDDVKGPITKSISSSLASMKRKLRKQFPADDPIAA